MLTPVTLWSELFHVTSTLLDFWVYILGPPVTTQEGQIHGPSHNAQAEPVMEVSQWHSPSSPYSLTGLAGQDIVCIKEAHNVSCPRVRGKQHPQKGTRHAYE